MSQLRKDPILGRWVIIAEERAHRPQDFSLSKPQVPEMECPFCRGKEHLTLAEIFSLKDQQGNWRVRVIPSRKPFLKPGVLPWKKGKGPYDLMAAVGCHETVVETPDHIAGMADLDEKQIHDVFSVYCGRMWELANWDQIKYVLAFKNYGAAAGGGHIRHARSQLIATPVNLKRVKEELEGAKEYYQHHERCVFCDMANQEMNDKDRIVLDEEGFMAMVPFAPRFPYEIWVLPKKHSPDFYKIDDKGLWDMARVMKKLLIKIKNLLGDPSYNYVIHTAPFRRPRPGFWSTIDEDFHWHIEITPHLGQLAGFEWGTGFYICPALPEETAKQLRQA
jgi:UDPglucose--hexose-1-phosphate uridylyltransferase